MEKFITLSLLSFVATTSYGQLLVGDAIGIDFGGTAETDTENDWNNITVGGNATTLGLADSGTVVIADASNLDGDATGTSFTFENSSGQIAWDFTGGVTGPTPFTNSTVYGDGIISNDASGRTVAATTDTFIFTFSDLDDELTYDLSGGWDSNNGNFEAIWSADGKSFQTAPAGAANAGYGTIAGLETDGSGNLVITVTGSTDNAAAHITVAALTLTAVPEPSAFALLAGCLALASVMVRRRRA